MSDGRQRQRQPVSPFEAPRGNRVTGRSSKISTRTLLFDAFEARESVADFAVMGTEATDLQLDEYCRQGQPSFFEKTYFDDVEMRSRIWRS